MSWNASAGWTGLNRRNLIKASAAACSLSVFSNSRKLHAQEPKRGGRMVLGSRHGSTTDTTDPALLTNGMQGYLAYAFTNTLTEVLADGSLGPALASSWDSRDAITWQFKIRNDVEFHNGRRLTADDVVASINHHRKADSKSSVKSIVDQIEEMAASGSHELRIRLKAANADLPTVFNDAAFTIYAAKDEGIDWQSRNGTGAYIVEAFEPGIKSLLKRNPNYWRTDRGFADEVELVSIADSTARTNALISGEVHAIDQVDLKTIDLVRQQAGVVVEQTSGPLHYTFPMLTDVAPFNDPNVRLALKHSIDRNDILEKILVGYGTIGNDTPIGPSYRYFASDLERNVYDPDRAKALLKKSGYENLSVDLSAADAAFEGAVDAAMLFSEHAKKSGITLNVIREPNDGYWDNVWLKKPFSACYWGGYPTESQMFAAGYAPGAAWNDTKWTNARFEELRISAAAEMDTVKRQQMYREMQEILRVDGGAIVVAFANNVMARSTRVDHGKLASNKGFDGERVVERWWVA